MTEIYICQSCDNRLEIPDSINTGLFDPYCTKHERQVQMLEPEYLEKEVENQETENNN